MLKVLMTMYVLDTLLTLWLTGRGGLEVNPLYWAFHDNPFEGIIVRVGLGLAVFYGLHRWAKPPLVNKITFAYGLLLAFMVCNNFLIGV